MLAIKRKKKTIEKVSKTKTPKQMERHLKGAANHRRIEILFLVADNEGITVEEISKKLGCNMKTISDHIIRLDRSGLINKFYKGRTVIHNLSPYGKIFHKFLTTFRHSWECQSKCVLILFLLRYAICCLIKNSIIN